MGGHFACFRGEEREYRVVKKAAVWFDFVHILSAELFFSRLDLFGPWGEGVAFVVPFAPPCLRACVLELDS